MRHLIALAALAFALALPGLAQERLPTAPETTWTRLQPRRELRLPIIDPAAVSIDFQILRRTDRFRGLVRVRGTVRNVGAAAFRSRPGQQTAVLLENGRVVARRAFTDLAPGQSIEVSFVRAWDISSPAEGEFAPTYLLRIDYDPDIRIDGNRANDDWNGRNNSLSRSGQEINDLFRRLLFLRLGR